MKGKNIRLHQWNKCAMGVLLTGWMTCFPASMPAQVALQYQGHTFQLNKPLARPRLPLPTAVQFFPRKWSFEYPFPSFMSGPPVLSKWTADELPFFCRIEHHLGKKTRVPFKFRLGSVEYVDWLEGKPGCTAF